MKLSPSMSGLVTAQPACPYRGLDNSQAVFIFTGSLDGELKKKPASEQCLRAKMSAEGLIHRHRQSNSVTLSQTVNSISRQAEALLRKMLASRANTPCKTQRGERRQSGFRADLLIPTVPDKRKSDAKRKTADL